MFDQLFPGDTMSKRDRVLATLKHQPVDRVGILEQLSYNPRVIARYTGKSIDGFNYTLDDIYQVIRQTTDLIMPAVAERTLENPQDRINAGLYRHANLVRTYQATRLFPPEAVAMAALIDDDVDWVIYGPVQVFPFAGHRRGKGAVFGRISRLSGPRRRHRFNLV